MEHTYDTADAAVEKLIYDEIRKLPDPGKISLLNYLRALVSKEVASFLPGTVGAQDP